MEINANYGQAQDIMQSEMKAQQAEALYQVKLIKMQQQTEEVVGTLLEDTAEISKEAMDKYLAEING